METERVGRTEEEIVETENFAWDGYQVVRREFFSHTFEPMMKFNYNSIAFSAACIRKLPDVMYVQFLVNQQTKQLIIKACDENAKDAVRWCTVDAKNGKRKSREIKSPIFSAKMFDMMGWNVEYRYKLLGTVISVKGERIIVFRLDDCETYIPVERGDNGAVKKMGRKPHYPQAWKDSFGLPLEEHTSQLQIDVLDNFARFEVVKPKPVLAQTPTQTIAEKKDGGNYGNQ